MVQLHAILNSALDGDEWLVQPPVPMGDEDGWNPEPVWKL
jgi:hypothetical protein